MAGAQPRVRAGDVTLGSIISAPSLTLFDAFASLWVFFLGTCVGSFLNVVVYRLPRGENLLRPGSRCPGCETPIEGRDNIPVIGWLALKGRCRSCQAAISIRYPVVEAVTGALYLSIALLLVNGVIGPGGSGDGRSLDGPFMTWMTHGELIATFLYEACLVTILWMMALFQYDRKEPTLALFLFSWAVGILVPLIWPTVRLTSTFGWPPSRMMALFDGIVGISLSMGLATFPRSGLMLALVVGPFLGGFAALAVALVEGFAQVVTRWRFNRPLPPLAHWSLVCWTILLLQVIWPRGPSS